jgi:hypothetical protein
MARALEQLIWTGDENCMEFQKSLKVQQACGLSMAAD